MAGLRILIVEARFYDDITDNLLRGAIDELKKVGAGYRRVIVPGIYEIPAAVKYAVRAQELRATDERFDGYVTLGCAIRGQSDHYDHVCNECMRGLQTLAVEHCLALGNGVLTVHNREQAMVRADPARKNLGGMAARACLRMIEVKRELSLLSR